jgi:hypothetical protein
MQINGLQYPLAWCDLLTGFHAGKPNRATWPLICNGFPKPSKKSTVTDTVNLSRLDWWFFGGQQPAFFEATSLSIFFWGYRGYGVTNSKNL